MKRKRKIQLNLFDGTATASFEEKVYADFRAHAFKVMAEGHRSICEAWWRSRFHDFLYPGHNQPKKQADWEYRNKAEKIWHLIFHQFEREVILNKNTPTRSNG